MLEGQVRKKEVNMHIIVIIVWSLVITLALFVILVLRLQIW